MKLKQLQVVKTTQEQELDIVQVWESGIDRSEFNWIKLGYVCYGMQNDVGYSRLYVMLGIKRDAKNKLKPTIVEVTEKYYSCEGNYDYEEFELHHSPRKNHHAQDIVYYKCPRNFNAVLETIIGKDTRTKDKGEWI
tara:strand:+ start:11277 stop:11684 length:408 start_codon:yes stop_codon:yes gene_type:complete